MVEYSRLESFIVDRMSRYRIPGLSIALVRGGRVEYARGFGFRDLERGARATPNTVYGVGSVTKSFTALSIMQLAEKGLLSLEDPVARYLPIKLRVAGEPVRVWHLLTHSTGIPALAYAEAFIRGLVGDDEAWAPIASCEDMISFMNEACSWAVARPGERFFYLNEGYVLLGCIIERVSGLDYDVYVRRNILEPLGMRRSYFNKEEVERDGDVAKPYIVTRDSFVESRFPYGLKADGGLLSNVLDLSRYLAMYINRGELDGARIASRESILEMEKPWVKLDYEEFGGDSYGYGWRVTPNFLGRKLVGHSGSVLVYTAYVGYLPQDGVGVAVLSNSESYPLSIIGYYALALMIGEDPEKLPQVRIDRVLDKLQGVYESYKGLYKVEVRRRGDLLYLVVKGRYTSEETPLIPEELGEDEAVFYTIRWGRRIKAVFRVKDGRVELLYERYKFVKAC